MAWEDAIFTKELIFTDLKAENAQSLLGMIAEKMVLQGLVTKDFGNAVKAREEMYPTGLPTMGLGVAMPHTDAEYVVKESFSVSLLSEPVVFKEMGSSGQSVFVHIVFMLALKDNHTQLDMLHGIVNIIQKPEFLQALYQEKNKSKIHDMIVKELESVSWE